MFGRIVNRVRDMFAPRSVVVKNPRVISADEHRIDPALVSAEARARRSSVAASRPTSWAVPFAT